MTSTNQQQMAHRTEIVGGGGFWRSLITVPSCCSAFTVIVIVNIVLCWCVQWGAAATTDPTEG